MLFWFFLQFTSINGHSSNKLAFFCGIPQGNGRIGDSQDTSRTLYTSIRGLPKDWRCRPGRPRRTWLRTMEADLQPLSHGLNSAWRLAQDRERWKQLLETATLQSGACPRWWWWFLEGPFWSHSYFFCILTMCQILFLGLNHCSWWRNRNEA